MCARLLFVSGPTFIQVFIYLKIERWRPLVVTVTFLWDLKRQYIELWGFEQA